jgi:hypothetical protein
VRRVFFGIAAIASGLVAVHFAARWLQLKDTTGCYGDADCQHRVMRGGDSVRDKQYAIGLFALAGVCAWMVAGKEQ